MNVLYEGFRSPTTHNPQPTNTVYMFIYSFIFQCRFSTTQIISHTWILWWADNDVSVMNAPLNSNTSLFFFFHNDRRQRRTYTSPWVDETKKKEENNDMDVGVLMLTRNRAVDFSSERLANIAVQATV